MLTEMAKEAGVKETYLHIIFDGRSTEPGSAPELLKWLDEKLDEIGTGKIVDGIGRGIALDRDHNYEKTEKAYNNLVFGTGTAYRE
jgi:2,3-bisphosphoglycerate-independent phosphoglycerate mutase